MPSIQASLQVVKENLQELGQELKDQSREVGRKIIRPRRLEAAADGATRTGQLLSLLVLGPVIMVSLTLIEVVHDLMSGVLGAGLIDGDQLTITGFMVTAITLALLIIVAWGWFQFVRTAGFGAFNYD